MKTASEQNAMTTRPFLRWAGSKRSVVPKLSEYVPTAYGRYFEPFVGSGALFFHLRPKRALISDLNAELINLYNQMKVRPVELHQRFTSIPRESETYYEIRANLTEDMDPLQRAVYFLYLNRNCFNGLYRTNKSGKFNVPYASSGRGGYPSQSDFELCSTVLRDVTIACDDFESVLFEHVAEGDFVYMDPPFIKSQGRIFNEYVKGHFANKDLDRLDAVLKHIHRQKAFFLLSLADDEIAQGIASQWDSRRHMVQKNISGFASARKKSSEILVKNW